MGRWPLSSLIRHARHKAGHDGRRFQWVSREAQSAHHKCVLRGSPPDDAGASPGASHLWTRRVANGTTVLGREPVMPDSQPPHPEVRAGASGERLRPSRDAGASLEGRTGVGAGRLAPHPGTTPPPAPHPPPPNPLIPGAFPAAPGKIRAPLSPPAGPPLSFSHLPSSSRHRPVVRAMGRRGGSPVRRPDQPTRGGVAGNTAPSGP